MGAGINGSILIDRKAESICFENVSGFQKDNEKVRLHILYIAKTKLKSENFPEKYTYATH